MSAEHEPLHRCCLCGVELVDDDIEAGYCEDCREGDGDLESLLERALDAG